MADIKTIVYIFAYFIFINCSPLYAQMQGVQENDLLVEIDYSANINKSFPNYPNKAIIVINSELEITFEESKLIVDIIGLEQENQHILIVEPVEQIISFSAPGFKTKSISIKKLQKGETQFFKVLPSFRSTKKRTIVVQTVPEGATLRLGINSETFLSNHTFSDLPLDFYRLTVSKEGYRTEVINIELKSDRPELVRVELVPVIGYIKVSIPGAILHLEDEDGNELRVNYSSSVPLKLPVGKYSYRLEKEFFISETGFLNIKPMETTLLEKELKPAYGTLRVYSNVRMINLTSDNNYAPVSDNRNEINLRYGLRKVTVSAIGHISKDIIVRISPGQTLVDTVMLESVLNYSERLAKEHLPKGILKIGVDVDADIYVSNVLRGKGEIVLALTPDYYKVEINHPLGNRILDVNVLSAEVAGYNVFLRPLRKRAIFYSTLIPGLGHIYRGNKRGYFYLGITAGSATATILSVLKKNQATAEYESLQTAYNLAQTLEEAAMNRERLLDSYQNLNDINSNLQRMLSITVAFYALQLFDAILTKPSYGYRENIKRKIGMSVYPGGVSLTARF